MMFLFASEGICIPVKAEFAFQHVKTTTWLQIPRFFFFSRLTLSSDQESPLARWMNVRQTATE